ncbi:MAG TPA: hypothetical protein VI854_07750, partial [Acidimicrobiia bacterium]|nr:hypothetical protein [Acidimicrobiia bacterium]
RRRATEPSATAVADDGAGPLRSIVGRIEERHGDTPLRFGGWHGDLTPWNLSRRGGGVHIWDWERASACVPFGFDAAHFEFQRTARYSSVDVAGAMASSRGRLGPRLRALDLDPGSDDALWLLYGLEILLRYEEARAEGALARPSTIHAGILALFAGSLAE